MEQCGSGSGSDGGGMARAGGRGSRLYRYGLEPESADGLARDAAAAEMRGYLYGVSVFSRSSRPAAASAQRAEVEAAFPAHKTGRNPYHYTVELPKPVTDAVADLFNRLFGRTGAP
jgi:hypothetical protein